MPADANEPSDPSPAWPRRLPLLVLLFAFIAAPFVGSARTADAGPDDEVLRAGAEVYASVCAACHQPGGVGLSGQFPPLLDNPHVADAAYVEGVIRNGRSGEIVVNGTTYNGVMPAQATLSDADISAVITYIQSGFASPATPAPAVDTGPVAGTELPALSNYAYLVAFLMAIGIGAFVLGPRVIAAHDQREVTWLDAWMKTAVIVVALIFAVVWVPARVLEFQAVQDLPRAGQDLIAVGLWFGALVVALLALWYAHRERRI
jgi:mono/diheme cytochrome c family protein